MPLISTPTGNSLHYNVHGDGPTSMLMLHGLSQSGTTFHHLLPSLLPGRRIVLCDLPGHGSSYHADDYHAEVLIADVAHCLQKVIGEPAIVYGHSLGSLVAAGLAAEHSELVSQLILSDPPLIVWDEQRWRGSIISSYFGWARKILQGGLSHEQIVPMLQTAFPHRSRETLNDQAIALEQMDVGVINALFDDKLTTLDEVLGSFAHINCPTLLLQADPRVLAAASDDDIAAIQARLPHSRHVKFQGADHDLHLWKAQKLLNVVHDFLAQFSPD